VSTDAPPPVEWGVLTARAWREPLPGTPVRIRVTFGVDRAGGTHPARPQTIVVDGWDDLVAVIRKWYAAIDEPRRPSPP
jgi:hypothetical protein